MDNQHISDFIFLKKSANNKAMKKAQYYVGKYLSSVESAQFKKAYCESKYDKANTILQKTLQAIRDSITSSEENIAKDIVAREFLESDERLKSIFIDEKESDDNMIDISSGLRGGTIAFIVIMGAILALAVIVIWVKSNKIDGANSLKKLKPQNSIVYTQKDSDMIELIHELSEVYQKTDEYMRS